MVNSWIIQGRNVTILEINFIRKLIQDNPTFTRSRISQEICQAWNWKNAKGQMKDMACRSLLLKLERKDLVSLPCRAKQPRQRIFRQKELPHSKAPIVCNLEDLQPVKVIKTRPGSHEQKLFSYLLDEYHYLGYKTSVGENMKYLLLDREDRILGCVLFGSAAWKTTPRDVFIGWGQAARQKNVNLITNNTRFLILPWVRVPQLASHVLSLIAKRIMKDWLEKYNHPVLALETFVDTSRFKGTCYKAANWVYLGKTKGRTRNDRFHNVKASIKDIYLYPLKANFREGLV